MRVEEKQGNGKSCKEICFGINRLQAQDLQHRVPVCYPETVKSPTVFTAECLNV